jgi:hypothetical protein
MHFVAPARCVLRPARAILRFRPAGIFCPPLAAARLRSSASITSPKEPQPRGEVAKDGALYIPLNGTDVISGRSSHKWKQATAETLNFHFRTEIAKEFFHPDANLFNDTVPSDVQVKKIRDEGQQAVSLDIVVVILFSQGSVRVFFFQWHSAWSL